MYQIKEETNEEQAGKKKKQKKSEIEDEGIRNR